MTTNAQRILNDALQLPPTDRAELIQRLFESFDRDHDPVLDNQWADEAESRIDAYDQGKLPGSLVADVFARINRQ